MGKARKDHWLIAQGYRTTTIPPIVTWYLIDKNTGMERELRGRTDDYTLNLYRGKGYVLDKKYLDPQLWNELEYGDNRPIVTVEPPEHSGTTPSQGYQRGCRREGFLARNSIGIGSPYWFSERGYTKGCNQVIHRDHEAPHHQWSEVLWYNSES
jgi:hypothetical protein